MSAVAPLAEVRPLRVLLQLVRHGPRTFALHSVLITTHGYLLPLVPGVLIRQVLDRASGDARGWSQAASLSLLAVWALAAGLGSSAVGGVVAVLRQRAEVLVRRNVVEHVLVHPGARALPTSTGDAIVRLTKDPEEISHGLDFLGDPLGQVLGFGLGFAYLGSIDAFLTLAVVVPAVAVMLLARLLGPRVVDARRRRQASIGGVSGLLDDAFTGVATIQAAAAQDRVTRRLVELGERRRRATLRDLLVDQVVQSLASNTAVVATGVLLLVAAGRARTGELSAGDLAAFASYLGAMAMMVAFTGQIITTLRHTAVSTERMGELLGGAPHAEVVRQRPTHLRGAVPHALPAVPSPPADPLGVLSARGLTFVHATSGRGIVEVDLELRRGELVAVTGEVGSGKTTLLRCLLGLLPADAGEICWNGRAIGEPDRFFVPPRAAYTPQVPRFVSASLRENVLLGLDVDAERLRDAAATTTLDVDLPAFDAGWQTLVGPRGTKLSGGQLHRAAAARMLVRASDLFVVDDLSSALDVRTEEQLWDRLLALPGATFLVVTHRVGLLERATRVITLADGRVAG